MVLLLTATAIVTAVAVAVLFVPIAVDLEVSKDAGDDAPLDVRTRMRWLGVNIPIRYEPSARQPRPPRPARPKTRSNRRISALLFSPGFLARSARLLAELAAIMRPSRFELDARVGFDDPSATGMLAGCLSVAALDRRLHVEPCFTAEILAGRLRVCWSRSIASLSWPVLKFLASPVIWRAVRRYRTSGG